MFVVKGGKRKERKGRYERVWEREERQDKESRGCFSAFYLPGSLSPNLDKYSSIIATQ